MVEVSTTVFVTTAVEVVVLVSTCVLVNTAVDVARLVCVSVIFVVWVWGTSDRKVSTVDDTAVTVIVV
jgi:hypothetical protein